MSTVKNNNMETQNKRNKESIETLEKNSEQIVYVTASVITPFCNANYSVNKVYTIDKVYCSNSPPTMSVVDYCKRLKHYSKCEPATWIAAIIYLDRRIVIHGAPWSILTIHRLLLASLVCAIKMWEDNIYSNRYYAKIGGVSTKELNQLERTFLDHLDWNLNVDEELFNDYFSGIRSLLSKLDSRKIKNQKIQKLDNEESKSRNIKDRKIEKLRNRKSGNQKIEYFKIGKSENRPRLIEAAMKMDLVFSFVKDLL